MIGAMSMNCISKTIHREEKYGNKFASVYALFCTNNYSHPRYM